TLARDLNRDGKRVGDWFAHAADVESQGEERFGREVIRRTLRKDFEGHDSPEAAALAEVAAVVFESFVAELLSLRVFAHVVAEWPERAFAPDVVAHGNLRGGQPLSRPRRVEKLVVKAPEVLERHLARDDAHLCEPTHDPVPQLRQVL